MDQARVERLAELFDRALALPRLARPAFVRMACGDDEELRRELGSLLEAHESSAPFFDDLAADVVSPASAALLASDAADLVPVLEAELQGRYRIERELGGGAMSRVFLAEDLGLGRKVVIKLLPLELAATMSGERFRREIQLAAQLQHSHIVPLLTAESSGRLLYYTMPFVAGESLRARLARDGALPVRDAARIWRDLLDALAYAHASGVAHRDIKPGNILLGDRNAQLTDFGIAGAIEAAAKDAAVAAPGFAIGTPAYMAPEQIGGPGAREPDHRADLYSAALVVYEMLEGRLPFDGRSSRDLLQARLVEEPRPVGRTDCPGELAAMVMRCLAKDPAGRPESAESLLAELEALGAGARPGVAPRPSPREHLRAWLMPGVALLVLLAAALAAWAGWSGSRAPQPPPGRVMLAVLPFENLTGDAGQDYFSDGLTEEMIAQLGQRAPERLGVIARTSVMRYKGGQSALDQIARELGVQYVLEGSVRRDANAVRVTAQLIHSETQAHIWARQYDRELTGLLTLQGEIAQQIADEILARLGPPGPAARAPPELGTRDYEAYDLYLKGQYFLAKRTTADLERAIGYFRQATTRDSAYARAYAALAHANTLLAGYSARPPAAFVAAARAAAQEALELDPDLPEAHVALALIVQNHDWNWRLAEQGFRRAIELNPNYATAHHWYAEHLMWRGRFDEALRESERARELDPLSLIIATDNGAILLLSRQYDRAIEKLQSVREMDPDFPRAGIIQGAYVEKGMYQAAIDDFEAQRHAVDHWYWSGRAYLYGRAGREAEARHAIRELLQLRERGGVQAGLIAGAFASVKDWEAALAWLEKAYEEHDNSLTGLKVDPGWDPLRSDPRFQSLLRRVGLAP